MKLLKTEYITIESNGSEDLSERVNNLIKNKGYEPLGGLQVTDFNGESKYYQAMIKKE